MITEVLLLKTKLGTRAVLGENYKKLSNYNAQPNLKEKNREKDKKQHSNLTRYGGRRL